MIIKKTTTVKNLFRMKKDDKNYDIMEENFKAGKRYSLNGKMVELTKISDPEHDGYIIVEAVYERVKHYE